MICDVLRPISGMEVHAGDRVDVTDWRNAKQLIRGRYLSPVEDEAQED